MNEKCNETILHCHHNRNCDFFLKNYTVDLLLKLIEVSYSLWNDSL